MRFGSRIRYARGYTTSDGETQPLEEIADAAQNVEAVVFVGGLESDRDSDLNSDRDSGTDRDSLALPDIQNIIIETLVAANPRTTVVIHSAGPVAMPWRDSAAAIVQAWHLGADGDQALAAVIAGEINPSGKLPFTYYSSLYECGAHVLGDYPGDPAADYIENYVDDIWVGYRYTDMKGDAARPAFPFGHGLSYTTFEYSDIKGNKETIAEDGTLKISLRVTNTGHRLGHEVVQLYIGDTYATAARPVKELKDFQKVMLEPGRSTRVTFTVDASMLSFFDPLRHDWIVEPGNFNAYIASSAGDIRGVVEFSVL